ncbi:MAG: hypothetical protein VR69_14000 [Peptococcaceae bacterium BRH_c4b]|nr:MAG: hypothetical protein VR69_14000 [Peptococcaceae bacterium BRH_c4b]
MAANSLWESFGYAIKGIYRACCTQRNMKIHYAVAVAVLAAACGLGIKGTELAMLIFAIALVIVAEMINTAIEAAIDTVVKEYNPQAGAAKDIAAGAVLLAAVFSVIIGLLIFYPHLRSLLAG